MKILKQDCEKERRVQQIEELMRQLGVSVNSLSGPLQVSIDGIDYPISSTDGTLRESVSFPRQFDEERLVVDFN